ncbi:hypothetical protein R3W88_011706 [Solanum pinnatisectum]|uniref:Uncharacterized protein n=1 Tax=Solanum pinnatisectum TaxID=50273 RepID=A0AAV9L7G5_9SOLN|nr:hypothetical protein R3W88_011706 [Solanum pinnatisectum]
MRTSQDLRCEIHKLVPQSTEFIETASSLSQLSPYALTLTNFIRLVKMEDQYKKQRKLLVE